MANWTNESEAREQIKKLVTEYYHDFKEKRKNIKRENVSHTQLEYLMRKKCVHLLMQH